jgi:hypothetical protein
MPAGEVNGLPSETDAVVALEKAVSDCKKAGLFADPPVTVVQYAGKEVATPAGEAAATPAKGRRSRARR